jgi:hypothetical protein
MQNSNKHQDSKFEISNSSGFRYLTFDFLFGFFMFEFWHFKTDDIKQLY